MIRMSLATGSAAPAGAGWGTGCEIAVVVVSGASATSVMSGSPSLPAHDEAVHAAVHRLFDELVAGGLRPGRQVLGGSRIGGEDLDQLAGRDRLDRLGGLDDRHGARQPAGVDVLADLDDCHGW